MNFKEGLVQGFFIVIIFTTLNYFIGSYFNPIVKETKETKDLAGQSFVAPEMQVLKKQLNLDFVVGQDVDKEKITQHKVVTNLGTYTFSSYGATLESLNIWWQNKTMNIELMPSDSQCFFVALNESSPINYDFVKEYIVDGKNAKAVEYMSKFDGGKIVKTFIIYNETYQIDLNVAIKYDSSDNVKSECFRVFFPMPISLDTSILPIGTSSYDLLGVTNKAAASGEVSLRTINICKQIQEFVFEPKVFGFTDKFLVQTFIQLGDQKPVRGYFKQLDAKNYQAILESNSFEKEYEQEWSFYIGPKVKSELQAVFPALEQTIDYGWFSFLANPMFVILKKLKDYTGNYGFAIIILTIILNLLLLPFKMFGEKSMRQQAEFQKKLTYIRQKYKHDKQALDNASAELIQKHGMPGFIGCLPMLLNIPFFIALSRLLSCSFELYGAHFFWINDLSAKDPFYVLGIFTGLSMLLTPVVDPKQTAMRYASALVFGTFTMYLSSGLALFILVNTLLSLLQGIITRRLKSTASNFNFIERG